MQFGEVRHTVSNVMSLSRISFNGMNFLIVAQPNEYTIVPYIENLLRNKVKTLVCVCEANYGIEHFKEAGIRVTSIIFLDGTFPSERIKNRWFRVLLDTRNEYGEDACVAVHCNSGLGRAALLVAIALIELGMSYDVAVSVIRSHRRGAISAAQYEYLSNYKSKSKLVQSRGVCLLQ